MRPLHAPPSERVATTDRVRARAAYQLPSPRFHRRLGSTINPKPCMTFDLLRSKIFNASLPDGTNETTGQPLCIPPKPPNQKLLCLLANRVMIVPMLLVCEDDRCADTELDEPALESWVVIRTVAARRWLWVASTGPTARRRSSKCCHPVRNGGQRSPAACRRQSPGPGSHRNSGYQSQLR